MEAFEYANPQNKEDAVKLLTQAKGDAVVLAGGTDLLSLMKDYLVDARRVVSLNAIVELKGVAYDESDGLRIGALATLDELIAEPRVSREYPALAQAIDGIRSPQIQNMGTVGGELCQRPRCWYYRNGFGLGQADGKSLIATGDNRYHAILGNEGPAYFVNPSSLAPALIALGATLQIFGPGGQREVALKDFYRAPQSEAEKEYHLADDEIVTQIRVPAAGNKECATYEVRAKESLDWPLAAAAVALERNGEVVARAQVVLGHVAPIPWISADAANVLTGNPVTVEVAQRAGEAAVTGSRPLSRNGYKVQLARVAVKRAILRASGMEV